MASLLRVWESTPVSRRRDLAQAVWQDVTYADGDVSWCHGRALGRPSPYVVYRGAATTGWIALRQRCASTPVGPVFVTDDRQPIAFATLRVLAERPDPLTDAQVLNHLNVAVRLDRDGAVQARELRRALEGNPTERFRAEARRLYQELRQVEETEGGVELQPEDRSLNMPPARGSVVRTRPPRKPTSARGPGAWLPAFADAIALGKVFRRGTNQPPGPVRATSAHRLLTRARAALRTFEQLNHDKGEFQEVLADRPYERAAWNLFAEWIRTHDIELPTIPGPMEVKLAAKAKRAPLPPPVPKRSGPMVKNLADLTQMKPAATGESFPKLAEHLYFPCYTIQTLAVGTVLYDYEEDNAPDYPSTVNPRAPVFGAERDRAIAIARDRLHDTVMEGHPLLGKAPAPWRGILHGFALWLINAERYSERSVKDAVRLVSDILLETGMTPDHGHSVLPHMVMDQHGRHTRKRMRSFWRRFVDFATEMNEPWKRLLPRVRPWAVRPVDAIPTIVLKACAALVNYKRSDTGESDSVWTIDALRTLTPARLVRDGDAVIGVQFPLRVRSGFSRTGIRTSPVPEELRWAFATLLAWRDADREDDRFNPRVLDGWPFGALTDDDPLLVVYPGVPITLAGSWLQTWVEKEGKPKTKAVRSVTETPDTIKAVAASTRKAKRQADRSAEDLARRIAELEQEQAAKAAAREKEKSRAPYDFDVFK